MLVYTVPMKDFNMKILTKTMSFSLMFLNMLRPRGVFWEWVEIQIKFGWSLERGNVSSSRPSLSEFLKRFVLYTTLDLRVKEVSAEIAPNLACLFWRWSFQYNRMPNTSTMGTTNPRSFNLRNRRIRQGRRSQCSLHHHLLEQKHDLLISVSWYLRNSR